MDINVDFQKSVDMKKRTFLASAANVRAKTVLTSAAEEVAKIIVSSNILPQSRDDSFSLIATLNVQLNLRNDSSTA